MTFILLGQQNLTALILDPIFENFLHLFFKISQGANQTLLFLSIRNYLFDLI